MRAIVWTAYGAPEVLQLQVLEKPSPKENEVLIRVHAASITAGDCEMRSLKLAMGLGVPMRLYAGLRRPDRIKVLGQEFAGEIAAVGQAVRRFQPGEAVFGSTAMASGAYAEYICLPERGLLAHKPANFSFEEAATLPVGGLEALRFLRQAAIQPGEKVLIVGAGGSIGTIGVQLAREYGAEVSVVDRASKLEMLRGLGASGLIDYAEEDFTRGSQRYDVIFDVAGKSHFGRGLQRLTPHGRYLLANPSLAKLLLGWWVNRTGRRRVLAAQNDPGAQDLVRLRELVEAGKLRTVIDRRYPLEQTAAAHAYVESGQKAGNVVIQVVEPHEPQLARQEAVSA